MRFWSIKFTYKYLNRCYFKIVVHFFLTMSLPSSLRRSPTPASQKKPAFRSVLDALTNFANLLPNQKVWSFLSDAGEVNDSYTYKV